MAVRGEMEKGKHGWVLLKNSDDWEKWLHGRACCRMEGPPTSYPCLVVWGGSVAFVYVEDAKRLLDANTTRCVARWHEGVLTPPSRPLAPADGARCTLEQHSVTVPHHWEGMTTEQCATFQRWLKSVRD